MTGGNNIDVVFDTAFSIKVNAIKGIYFYELFIKIYTYK